MEPPTQFPVGPRKDGKDGCRSDPLRSPSVTIQLKGRWKKKAFRFACLSSLRLASSPILLLPFLHCFADIRMSFFRPPMQAETNKWSYSTRLESLSYPASCTEKLCYWPLQCETAMVRIPRAHHSIGILVNSNEPNQTKPKASQCEWMTSVGPREPARPVPGNHDEIRTEGANLNG